MTPEEEAYAEALRRIREAEANGAVVLDLSKLSALNRLPRELERLSSLQTLNLSGCKQLSGDLTPLTGLTSLQSLDLSANQLSSLPPEITKLTSLQSLDLRSNQLSSLPPEIWMASLQPGSPINRINLVLGLLARLVFDRSFSSFTPT